MQIPSRCSLADDLRWGAATLAAVALCLFMTPALLLLWLVGRCAHGTDR